MSYGLICAHCRAKVRIRTSIGEHLLLRTAYLQCTNEACGATFRAAFEITHTLSPSAMPNPSIQLPMAPSAMRHEAVRSLQGDDSQGDLLDDIEEQEFQHASGAA